LHAFIQLANQLGIDWFCLADGDLDGRKYAEEARALLNGRDASVHIMNLPSDTIEEYLCENGHADVYLKHQSIQKAGLVTASPGDPNYAKQLIASLERSFKEPCVIDLMEKLRLGAEPPGELIKAIDLSIRLSQV
jgi:predicted ATP-dependent endonuclease of OLD family